MVRVMTPGKVAEGTKDRAVRCLAQWGWEEGPFTVSMLLSKAFSIGSKFTDSCHEEWFNFAQQTAEGQCLATTLYCDDSDGSQDRMKDGDWDEHCRTCGPWSKIYDKVLPACQYAEEDINILCQDFKENESFSKSVANLIASTSIRLPIKSSH